MKNQTINLLENRATYDNLIVCHDGSVKACPRPETEDSFDGRALPFVCGKVGFLQADGSLIYDDDAVWDSSFIGHRENRHVVVLGDKICVFPDKVYYDTTSHQKGRMEADVTARDKNLAIAFDDGTVPSAYYYSAIEPENAPSGAIWVQKEISTGVYNVWRKGDGNGVWDVQDKIFYRLKLDGGDEKFAVGQKVYVSNLATSERTFDEFSGVYRVGMVGPNDLYLEHKPDRMVLPRICRASNHHIVAQTIRVKRQVPNIVCPVVSGGRIWGVENSTTIRACARGDIFSWQTEDGGEDDSVTIESFATSSLAFGCEYEGAACFASTRELVRVVGSRPDNYAITTTPICGVKGLCYGDGKVWWIDGADKLQVMVAGVGKDTNIEDLPSTFLHFYGKNLFCVGKTTTKVVNVTTNCLSNFTISPQNIWNYDNVTHFAAFDGHKTTIYKLCDSGGVDWHFDSKTIAVPSGYLVREIVADVEGVGDIQSRVNTDLLWGLWRGHTLFGRRKIRIPCGMRECDYLNFEMRGSADVILHSVTLVLEG